MTKQNTKDVLMTDVDPYVALANGIILQACKDYRKYYRLHLRTYRIGDKPNEKLAEVEKFFRSEWSKSLTSVDGEYVMKRIREDVQAHMKV